MVVIWFYAVSIFIYDGSKVQISNLAKLLMKIINKTFACADRIVGNNYTSEEFPSYFLFATHT